MFLMFYWADRFWEEDHRSEVQCRLSTGLIMVHFDLGHLAEVVFIGFLPCNVTQSHSLY